ncbi:hypothetical protein CYMTET_30961, partial [Cymbomonas tetramitiformis]
MPLVEPEVAKEEEEVVDVLEAGLAIGLVGEDPWAIKADRGEEWDALEQEQARRVILDSEHIAGVRPLLRRLFPASAPLLPSLDLPAGAGCLGRLRRPAGVTGFATPLRSLAVTGFATPLRSLAVTGFATTLR